MKNLSRKVVVIIVIVLFVAVIGIAGVILLQLQANQAPTDSNASGFGSDHTTGLYNDVVSEFKNTTCDFMLNQAAVSGLPAALGISNSVLKTTTLDRTDAVPISCIYKLGASKTVTFSLTAYNVNSAIDDTAEALYARINKLTGLNTTLDTGMGVVITYFYGAANDDVLPVCQANIFHGQNDFEYAHVTYTGFGVTDCNDLKDLNKKLVVDVFGFKLLLTMVGINNKYVVSAPTSSSSSSSSSGSTSTTTP